MAAEDKVVQHNGGGTVAIDGFCVEDFGKLYRSCGNCDEYVFLLSFLPSLIDASTIK